MKRGSDHDQFGRESHGRIPESLIDAALDGEICDQMQEEIAHALRYDHARRAELLETADAVRALDLDDIPMPDMQCVVLNRLDQQERFIPRAMRRWVRTGRMAIAAGVLLGLMMVAGLQSMYPRLTTIGAQSTPVDDVATAMAEESQRVVAGVQDRVEHVRASLSPLEGLLSMPRTAGGGIGGVGGQSFSLTMNHQVVRLSAEDLIALHASGVGEAEEPCSAGSRKRGTIWVSYIGGEGRLLVGSDRDGVVVVQGKRGLWVDREVSSDERIVDLP